MLKVAIISPFPPIIGGMTVLARSLQKCLESNMIQVIPINTHPEVKPFLGINKTVRLLQWIYFTLSLLKVRYCKAAIVIASSGDYFYFKAIPALYICRLYRCKIILNFVGGGFLEFERKRKIRLIRVLRKFDAVMVPSTPFKMLLEKEGLKCTLLPHIVETERFVSVEKNLAEPVFLSAKAFMEYSNIESIIKAFSIVIQQIPNARLFIAGDGPQKEYLNSLAQKMGLNKSITFKKLPNEVMPEMYKKATIFLHATRVESFGIAIVEAMASGTPVISTNVGGIPDIIKNGENGFLIEYNDHEAMADRIMYLIKNPHMYEKFIVEGLKTAKLYSSESLGPQLVNLIYTVINTTK